jgi:lysozyme
MVTELFGKCGKIGYKIMHRYINSRGINLIKHFEGFRKKPYICAGGHLTIGFGHKILAHENFSKISYSEGEFLLRKDLQIVEKAVLRNIRSQINDNQFAALVSFTFNLGAGALQRSTIRQKINYGQHQEASIEFLRWVYAKGKISNGLVKRRQAEYDLYETS